MQEELVTRKQWIGERRFLHALNFCMLLPGPEAQQLATYCGWVLHGVRGGIVAGALFVLPSALLLWVLSLLFMMYGDLAWTRALLEGLQAAVIALVAAALIRIGSKVLKNPAMWALAALSFVGIAVLHLPFPLIILMCGLIGGILGPLYPRLFTVLKSHGAVEHGEENLPPGRWKKSLLAAVICALLWWLPILATGLWLGWRSTQFQMGVFFSKAALVTFGGAYAVLPYVGQQAVERYGWISAEHMLVGLGLAETTPGPLIMVLQFVGFVGAWQNPGALSPLWSATLGAAITTWATFLPCFMWIFAFAPVVEYLRDNTRLTAALSAITAAVVGVVLQLALWFAWHVVVPATGGLNWFPVVLAVAAFVALVHWKKPLHLVLIACAVAALVKNWAIVL